MTTAVTGVLGRELSDSTFADLTPSPFTASANADGSVTLTFDADLDATTQNSILARMQSVNSVDQTLRSQANSALTTNRNFLAITSPTQAQVVAQVQALTHQNVKIIRQVLGLLDGTD